MTATMPWLNRKFGVDFPLSLYPNVLARVRGTPPRLEEAVQCLSQEQLITKRDGKWSIQENVGHLLDVEGLFWRRLQEEKRRSIYWPPCDSTDARLLRRMLEGGWCAVLTRLYEAGPRLAVRQCQFVRITGSRRLFRLCRPRSRHRICIRDEPDGNEAYGRPSRRMA